MVVCGGTLGCERVGLYDDLVGMKRKEISENRLLVDLANYWFQHSRELQRIVIIFSRKTDLRYLRKESLLLGSIYIFMHDVVANQQPSAVSIT